MFTLDLPMRVQTSSKKKTALNLNVYRNLHHRSLHAQKKKFEELAKKLLRGMPQVGVITLHYEVFVNTKRRLDIMNVGSIVDKYFSDTLTEVGIIEDDDYVNITEVKFSFGGLVKKEHIRVTITEIEPRKGKLPMRVLLDQSDIQAALTTYVSTLNIPNATGVQLDYNNGVITAEVMFGVTENAPDDTDSTEEAPKPKRGRGGRPKGSKNKPKDEETPDVDAPVQDRADISSAGDTSGSEVEAPETSGESETTEGETPVKGNSRKNLFGDKDDQSSEDDGQAEAAPDSAPEDVPAPVKRGSIFDA